jgi:hypothetical protein
MEGDHDMSDDAIVLPLTGPQIVARLAATTPQDAQTALLAVPDQAHQAILRQLMAPLFGVVVPLPSRRASDPFAY